MSVYEEEDMIVSGSEDSTVRIWSPTQECCKHVLTGHTGKVLCVKSNSDFVVSSAEDDSIRVWKKDTGECK